MHKVKSIHVFIELQISEATDAQSLRCLCISAVDTTMEAGYTLPLTSLKLDNREDLIKTLRLHHVILRSKAVLDQLMSGLSCLGVLEAIQRNPVLFQPFFIADKQVKLTSGKNTCSLHSLAST